MEKLLILYGTQTGTALDVAERMYDLAEAHFLEPRLVSLASYAPTRLPTEDSSYSKYNVVAKRLHRRLLQLGGQALLDCGNGDDQHEYGFEGALVPWLKLLWAKLSVEHHHRLLPNTPKFQFHFGEGLKPAPRFRSEPGPFTAANPYHSLLVENRRLTAADWEQDVRHLEFDIQDANIKYNPGDVVCIWPQNPADKVTALLSLLQLNPETLITGVESLKRIEGPETLPSYLPLPCTLRDLFTFHLDFLGVPRLGFYQVLSHFAIDEREREKLADFCSPGGQGALLNYNYRAKRTHLEVLEQFASARPPLPFLLGGFPRLRPREFSISSYSEHSPGRLAVTMAVVEFQALYKRTKRGLFSSWVAALSPADKPALPLWVKPGTIAAPPAADNLIMIGPGTGLAVFRAFIQQRLGAWLRGEATGETLLFFGCRHRDKDFLYRSELELWSEHGLQLSVAFSRDQVQKDYVQHHLRRSAETLCRLIGSGAKIYLSGNARRMPIDVREALVDVLASGGRSPEEAAAAFERMSQTGQFFQETWF